MSVIPEVKVEIEVDPNAGLQPFFTLDDSETGVLDGEYGLGGLAYADISAYVQAISIDRGKPNILDSFDAGNASVLLTNTERIFDPQGTSPFSQQLLPRRGIRMYSGGTPIFFGIVEDWALDYDKSGDNTARAIATDKFLLLANQELDGYTNTIQKTGDRLNTVLDKNEVQWPVGERDIDTGQIELQADIVEDNTNVLSYLQKIAETEGGSLFISADGNLTFEDKLKGPDSSDLLIFADDGSGVPFQELAVIIGGEFLYNRVIVEAVSGSPQIVEDTDSQQFFGISVLSKLDLLFEFDIDALFLANSLLVKYRNPGYRFDQISTNLNALTESQQAEVLAKEMTDVIQVIYTPNGIGNPISKYGQIIGIEHNVSVEGTHFVTFKLDTLDFAPFVLDDPVFGVLDDYGLG